MNQGSSGRTSRFLARWRPWPTGSRGTCWTTTTPSSRRLRAGPSASRRIPRHPCWQQRWRWRRRPARDGSELLAAYVAGVEVACRLGDAVEPNHYMDGFHPTGTLGVFGAAAACSYLLGLDRERVGWALGIAGGPELRPARQPWHHGQGAERRPGRGERRDGRHAGGEGVHRFRRRLRGPHGVFQGRLRRPLRPRAAALRQPVFPA